MNTDVQRLDVSRHKHAANLADAGRFAIGGTVAGKLFQARITQGEYIVGRQAIRVRNYAKAEALAIQWASGFAQRPGPPDPLTLFVEDERGIVHRLMTFRRDKQPAAAVAYKLTHQRKAYSPPDLKPRERRTIVHLLSGAPLLPEGIGPKTVGDLIGLGLIERVKDLPQSPDRFKLTLKGFALAVEVLHHMRSVVK